MGDLATGLITNGRANAICNAAGKILTTVKLEQQYGAKGGNGQTPRLNFVEGPGELSPAPMAVGVGGK